MQNLAHYLSEHDQTLRDVVTLNVSFPLPAAELWSKLIGDEAVLMRLREGLSFDLPLFGRESVRGVVKLLNPGRRFMGTIEQLKNAMLVMTLHDKGESSKLSIELSTYGLDQNELKATKRSWGESLRALGGVMTEE